MLPLHIPGLKGGHIQLYDAESPYEGLKSAVRFNGKRGRFSIGKDDLSIDKLIKLGRKKASFTLLRMCKITLKPAFKALKPRVTVIYGFNTDTGETQRIT